VSIDGATDVEWSGFPKELFGLKFVPSISQRAPFASVLEVVRLIGLVNEATVHNVRDTCLLTCTLYTLCTVLWPV
jgi:hypothetical protein